MHALFYPLDGLLDSLESPLLDVFVLALQHFGMIPYFLVQLLVVTSQLFDLVVELFVEKSQLIEPDLRSLLAVVVILEPASQPQILFLHHLQFLNHLRTLLGDVTAFSLGLLQHPLQSII